jgi:RNA polymerase sigma-70 factor (ECF subfamily)
VHGEEPRRPQGEQAAAAAAADAVERTFRAEQARVLGALVRHVGDFDVAEEAVQDAFAAAVATWPRDGVPANPAGWVTATARRKAVDRIRRARTQTSRAERLAEEARLEAAAAPAPVDPQEIRDDQLRLVFTCCHPALSPQARVALTLRAVAGLSTAEIARAFLVSEATMGQRISRAKRKIVQAHIPYRVPTAQELPDRVDGVLGVLYLLFNEGYTASAGERLQRGDLCDEAVRLARLVTTLLPGQAEAWGLLALSLLHDARRPARVDDRSRFVALDAQDRSAWDRRKIDEGTRALQTALALRSPGPYQLQAAIAALHAEAPSAQETDWEQIALLYGELARVAPSPVVEVNRAVAVCFAEGAEAGLRLLRPFLDDPDLERFVPLHAAHAELARRTGDVQSAATAYRRAVALSGNAVERAELRRRLAELGLGP